MPRKLRVKYPGAMYHVMSRGDTLYQTYYRVGSFGNIQERQHPIARMDEKREAKEIKTNE